MLSFITVAIVSAILVGTASAATYPGVKPKSLFGTPGKAAYCTVTQTSQEDWSPALFCWTPNDGFGVHLNWRRARIETYYYTERPQIVHGTAVLVGYAPRSKLLGFGREFTYRCEVPESGEGCGVRRAGVLVIRCKSARTGLTCRNAAGRGFWLGRFHGFRRLQPPPAR